MTLLNRIAENLKQRDWSTLLLELFILTVGVFFGIQAAN